MKRKPIEKRIGGVYCTLAEFKNFLKCLNELVETEDFKTIQDNSKIQLMVCAIENPEFDDDVRIYFYKST